MTPSATATAIIAIEASGPHFSVALQHADAHYASDDNDGLTRSRDLPKMAACVLEQAALQPHAITTVAVNTGPGGLGAVRTGIAFANGLAYALECSMWAMDAFTLMRTRIHQQAHHRVPTLCTANGADNRCYAQLQHADTLSPILFGSLTRVTRYLTQHYGLTSLETLTLAGTYSGLRMDQVQDALPTIRVHDSGIAHAHATDFFLLTEHPVSHSPLVPINEQTDGVINLTQGNETTP